MLKSSSSRSFDDTQDDFTLYSRLGRKGIVVIIESSIREEHGMNRRSRGFDDVMLSALLFFSQERKNERAVR